MLQDSTGMARTALFRVLNCRTAVSIDPALRLEQAGVRAIDPTNCPRMSQTPPM